jgi:hypothetical protein
LLIHLAITPIIDLRPSTSARVSPSSTSNKNIVGDTGVGETIVSETAASSPSRTREGFVVRQDGET